MSASNLPGSYVGALGSGNPLGMLSVISGATPADASIAVSTSNLERLRITSSGCVGIGKSNAAYTLDVVGNINFTGTLRSNNTPLSFNLTADITVDNVDAKASARTPRPHEHHVLRPHRLFQQRSTTRPASHERGHHTRADNVFKDLHRHPAILLLLFTSNLWWL